MRFVFQQGNHAAVEASLSTGQYGAMTADDRGYTAAHWAASLDDATMVYLLLRHHPELARAVTKRGMTVLHVAVMNNARRAVEMLIQMARDQAIPIYINARNQWLETPLHLAAALGQKDIATLLTSEGADLHSTDSWGRTPRKVSVISADEFIVNLIMCPFAHCRSQRSTENLH